MGGLILSLNRAERSEGIRRPTLAVTAVAHGSSLVKSPQSER